MNNAPAPGDAAGPFGLFNQGLVRPSPLPANAPTEQDLLNLGHLQQQPHHPRPPHPMQQQMAAARMAAAQQMPRQLPPHAQPDILSLIYNAPGSAEILKRPEVQSLNLALRTGEVTPNHLLEQFTHGNLPQLQREILLNVLKVQQNLGNLPTRLPPQSFPQPPQPMQQQAMPMGGPGGGGGLFPNQHISPRTSPLQEQLQLNLLQQQQQRLSPYGSSENNMATGSNNLAVSPTSGQQRRGPSPQELVFHAQQIMQNALIRRKLEEQKENYRKRQEATTQGTEMRGRSNSDPKSESPLPMSPFTPLAVMKKLAADRRDSDPRPQIPELRVSQTPPTSSSTSSVDQRPSQFGKGQNSVGERTSPHGMMPPVPLPVPNHLLLMQQQHQQQQAALQMAALQQGAGPRPMGVPQQHEGLSRFFSQEVLAQAQSGNAPSMPPVPRQKAMTLDEIESQAAAAAAAAVRTS